MYERLLYINGQYQEEGKIVNHDTIESLLIGGIGNSFVKKTIWNFQIAELLLLAI